MLVLLTNGMEPENAISAINVIAYSTEQRGQKATKARMTIYICKV